MKSKGEQGRDDLSGTVSRKAKRRLKARSREDRGVWFGLGMFGMIGWTVAMTTLAGVALGIWLDGTWPGPISWTLTLLALGLALGCWNAWYWINREGRPDEVEEKEKEDRA